MKKLLAAMFVALLMVGCGIPDLDDNETRNRIAAEAIDWGKLQEKGEDGRDRLGLAYAPISANALHWMGEGDVGQ